MKKGVIAGILIALLLAGCAAPAVIAEDSPTPIATVEQTSTPVPTITPTPTVSLVPSPTVKSTPAPQGPLTEQQMSYLIKYFTDAIEDSVVESFTEFTESGNIVSIVILSGDGTNYDAAAMRDLMHASISLMNTCAQAAVVLDDVEIADSDIENGYFGGLFDMYNVVFSFYTEAFEVIYKGFIVVGTHEIIEQ